MSKKLIGIFWGLVLIAGGLLALAQTMGYQTPQDPTLWAFIFAGISLASLVFYLLEGLKHWGWLFPTGVFGALAVTLGLVARGVDGAFLGAPIFIGLAIPFIAAYITDRSTNWWSLIPAGIMAFFSLVVLVVDRVKGEYIGAALFFTLAAVFFLVYLGKRAIWSAITGYVFLALGFMPLIATFKHPEFAGIILFLAIGLPFLFVYLRSPEHWWAVIPAGILLTMGLVTAIILLPGMPSSGFDPRFANSIIFAGMTATFAVVWLRHHKGWAMILSTACALIAVVALFLRDINNAWALFVVAAGVYILYNALRSKTA